MLVVTLWPTTADQGLEPYIDRLPAKLWSNVVPRFVGHELIWFSANIVFLMPVGFLLGVLLPFRLSWLAVAEGGIVSGAVETAHGLFLPDRASRASGTSPRTRRASSRAG